MFNKAILAAILAVFFVQGRAQSQPDTNVVIKVAGVDWSKDGEQIYFTFIKFDKAHRAQLGAKCYAYDVASKKLNQLPFEGRSVAVSPDRKKVAFIKPNENNKNGIYLYDLLSRTEQPLVKDTFNNNAPRWSPDGRSIAFNRQYGTGRTGAVEICIVDVSTGQVRQVTESGGSKSYEPVWSPQGDQIAYYLEKGDNHDQIYITDASGSFHKNLTNDTTTHNYFPCWMNESEIVYTDAKGGLMVVNTSGGRKKMTDINTTGRIVYNPYIHSALYMQAGKFGKLRLVKADGSIPELVIDEESLQTLF